MLLLVAILASGNSAAAFFRCHPAYTGRITAVEYCYTASTEDSDLSLSTQEVL